MKRVISVWTPDWPITVWKRADRRAPGNTPPEEASPSSGEAPFALVERGPRGLSLLALNAAARAAGLHRGQSHADARAILPALISAPAEPERDLEALRRLALWAERFSPLVSVDAGIPGHEGLFIDMTGGAHLFGGEAMLLGDLRRRLTAADIPARLAIADTPAAAWALARFAPVGGSRIAPPGGTREALAGLPVESLRLAPDAVVLLKRFGLRRVGDLYGLPRAGLARRFRGPAGLDVVRRLDQALGISDEALVPERPAPLYRVWAAFAEPVIDIPGVDIRLPRLAEALCGQLSRDGLGARGLALTGFRVDGRTTRLEASLSAPSIAPAHLLRLLREKGLARLDLGFGIDALMLSADRAEPLAERQGDMGAGAAPIDDPPIKAAKAKLVTVPKSFPIEGGEPRSGGEGFAGEVSVATKDPSVVSRQLPQRGSSGSSRPEPATPQWGSHKPAPEDLAALIDRLRARLGDGAVLRPQARESWIPERSEVWLPAGPEAPIAGAVTDRPRPIQLLERPEPVEAVAVAPDHAPARFIWRRVQRRVVRAEGPERLSAEWWRAGLPGVPPARTRDYYRVEDAEGRRYWLYREGLYAREDADQRPAWWMQGMFA